MKRIDVLKMIAMSLLDSDADLLGTQVTKVEIERNSDNITIFFEDNTKLDIDMNLASFSLSSIEGNVIRKLNN